MDSRSKGSQGNADTKKAAPDHMPLPCQALLTLIPCKRQQQRDADAIVVAQPAAGMRSLAGEGEQSICSWLLTLMQVSAVEAVRLPVAPGALPATLLL